MYEAFYGLREKPFSLTPDPKYLYPSRSHREALDHLLYGIQEREGFIVITGDVGTGKTTLCRAILAQLDRTTRTALILNPVLSEEELLRAILHDFGLPGRGSTKKELIDELNAFLIQALTEGQNAVLIIDESQSLSPELLEQVRLLSNLETEREKLIQIILVGQLGLLDLLARPELKQLNQRVSVRYRLRPLSFHETCQYIYHRLTVAGGSGSLTLATPALGLIHRYSGGIPRLVNLVCDRALLQGFVDQSTHIDRRRVERAIQSLRGEVESAGGGSGRRRLLPIGAAVLALLLLAGGWLIARGPSLPSASPQPPAGEVARPGAEDPPFTVLVDTYPTERQAREVARWLGARGHDVFVATWASDGGRRDYGVMVGRYRRLDEASQMRERLVAEEGLNDVRVVRVLEGSPGAQP